MGKVGPIRNFMCKSPFTNINKVLNLHHLYFQYKLGNRLAIPGLYNIELLQMYKSVSQKDPFF